MSFLERVAKIAGPLHMHSASIKMSVLALLLAFVMGALSPTFAVTNNPTARQANNRGLTHSQIGRNEEAIQEFSEAIRHDANYAEAYRNRGMSRARIGQYALAAEDFDQVVKIGPHTMEGYANREDALVETYTNRGLAYKLSGQQSLAIMDFNEAIRLKPGARVYAARCDMHRELRNYDHAVQDCSQSIRLDPKYSPAHNRLAWILSTAGDAQYRDGKKAIEHALMACELTQWNNVATVDTLAAVYAELGQYAEAIKWQEKALAIGGWSENRRIAAQERLNLYRQGKPYRE